MSIIPETRVVVADVNAFLDIYWIFLFYQYELMNKALGKYSSHMTREFYSSYAATLIIFSEKQRQLNGGRKILPLPGIRSI